MLDGSFFGSSSPSPCCVWYEATNYVWRYGVPLSSRVEIEPPLKIDFSPIKRFILSARAVYPTLFKYHSTFSLRPSYRDVFELTVSVGGWVRLLDVRSERRTLL